MSQFKTIKKSDPEYRSYLWGTFSKTHRALAINTLNLDSDLDEQITFEIVPKSLINSPSRFLIFFQLIKIRNIFLMFIPFFYVLIKNEVDNRFFDPTSFYLSGLACLFLFIAFGLKNEINDHVSGYDRVNTQKNIKPIGAGWISAKSVLLYSWITILLSLFAAIPVFLKQTEAVYVVIVCAVLIFLGQLLTQNSYKNKRWGEIIFFILVGPGVCSGYQTALGAGIDTEVLVFGFMWAWAIQFLVHLNHFQNLLTCSQAKIKNTMTNVSFDQAKKILMVWWLLFIVLWILYHSFYSSLFWSWFTSVILIFWSIPTIIHISEVISSVGSDLAEIKKRGYRNFLLMSGLIVIEFLWYFGNNEGWFT